MNISDHNPISLSNQPEISTNQNQTDRSLDKQLENLRSPRDTKTIKPTHYPLNSSIESFFETSLQSLAKNSGSDRLRLISDSYGADKQAVVEVNIRNQAVQLAQL